MKVLWKELKQNDVLANDVEEKKEGIYNVIYNVYILYTYYIHYIMNI